MLLRVAASRHPDLTSFEIACISPDYVGAGRACALENATLIGIVHGATTCMEAVSVDVEVARIFASHISALDVNSFTADIARKVDPFDKVFSL